mmetsp:Transcript_113894/g.233070  ORF Transcript_113894/g.233070 Transcript_113894/m.233070 type:complete len:88 (+) Transcript_113894:119-382(+)
MTTTLPTALHPKIDVVSSHHCYWYFRRYQDLLNLSPRAKHNFNRGTNNMNLSTKVSRFAPTCTFSSFLHFVDRLFFGQLAFFCKYFD